MKNEERLATASALKDGNSFPGELYLSFFSVRA
jgi:hypothetical protein